MTSFQILRHAWRMLANNRAEVTRLLIPVLAAFVLLPLIQYLAVGTTAHSAAETFEPAMFWWALAVAVVQSLVAYSVIVAWHRFVLLEEPVAALWTPVPPMRVLAYFLRMLLLSLVVLPVMALALGIALSPVFLVMGATTGPGEAAPGGMLAIFVIGGAVTLVIYGLSLRLSTVLPAAAIGAPLGLRGAWRASAGQGRLFLGVAIGIVLIGILVAVLSIPLVVAGVPLLAACVQGAIGGVVLLYMASILTTLYGVFIEGRDLT